MQKQEDIFANFLSRPSVYQEALKAIQDVKDRKFKVNNVSSLVTDTEITEIGLKALAFFANEYFRIRDAEEEHDYRYGL